MSKSSRVLEGGSRDFIVEPEEEALRSQSQHQNQSHQHLHPPSSQSRRSRREEDEEIRRSRIRVLSRSRSRPRRVQDRDRDSRSITHSRHGRPDTVTDSDDELYDSLFGEEELLTLQIPDDVSGVVYQHQHQHHPQNSRSSSTDPHNLNSINQNSNQQFELDSNNLNLSSNTMNPSLSMPDRNRVHHHHHHAHHSHHQTHHESTASLLDSMERRTQRTYRYGIGLVCVGATLNWLGFAQGHGYVDPLRYLGVACVISGSFCVCLAMCRWLGRPISVSSHHHVGGLSPLDYQDERNVGRHHQNGDVHVINVSVPMYVPHMHEEYRPTKPPDYEIAVAGEPPPYDEAIKLRPNDLFSATSNNPMDKSAIQNSTSSMGASSDTYFSCVHPSPGQGPQSTSQSNSDYNSNPTHLSIIQTHSQVQGHASQMVAVGGASGGDQVSSSGSSYASGEDQNHQNSHGVSVTMNPSSTSSSSMSTSLAESNQAQSSYRASSSFRPDGVVVVVDASESANPVLNMNANTNLNSVKNGSSLNSSMGAPPPYTREYTPSPRRAPSTPSSSSVSVSNSSASGEHLNPNSNSYSIASVHSYHNNPSNSNQVSSVASDNQSQNYSNSINNNGNSAASVGGSNSERQIQSGNLNAVTVTMAEADS